MNDLIINNKEEFCPSYKGLGYYENMSEINNIQSSNSGPGKLIAVSLNPGDDVIPVIKRICLKEKIRGAFVSGMGAADRIPIAAFNLKTGKYDEIVKTGYHEVSSINGNVSTILDEDNNLVDLHIHLHITFADIEGKAYAGHLLTGFSSSAVGELYIQEITGGMYRFQREISKNGYSMIRFNINVNKDLIPECETEENILNLNDKFITKEDTESIVNSKIKKIRLSKESGITSEAKDFLKLNNIEILIG